MTGRHLARVKQQCRVLLLLDAAEQVGIVPMASERLHGFAYLADVLSPVWGLVPFDGKIYKSEGGPHYPDLQEELDRLVVLGLVEVVDLRYEEKAGKGARILGSYALHFESPQLASIMVGLGARGVGEAVDPVDSELHGYLVELAGALSTLPDKEIESATEVDVTYRVGAELHDVVDFSEWVEDRSTSNPSWRVAERFESFLPEGSKMRSGEKLYLYAAYLGQAMHGD